MKSYIENGIKIRDFKVTRNNPVIARVTIENANGSINTLTAFGDVAKYFKEHNGKPFKYTYAVMCNNAVFCVNVIKPSVFGDITIAS